MPDKTLATYLGELAAVSTNADADKTPVLQGTTLRAATRDKLLENKPLGSSTGATVTLTAANAAGTEHTATHTAAITATFDATGMVAGDWGRVRQGGAGAVTLAPPSGGPAITFAPHVSGASTNGLRGWIDWVYRGSNQFEVVGKSVDNTGGGGLLYTSFVDLPGPNDENPNTVYSVALPAGMTTGDSLEIQGQVYAASGRTQPTFGRIALDGVDVTPAIGVTAAHQSRTIRTVIGWGGPAAQRSTYYAEYPEAGGGVTMTTAVDTTASKTLQFKIQKNAADTAAAGGWAMIFVRVNKA